jgi:membrane protein implicated in regulation of membrane protease activity
VAHSATSGPVPVRPAGTDDPSIGSLVQSAMADMSTLVRSEIELAKTEITTSAKKAAISGALFAVAGVLLAFAGIYFFFTIAEVLDLWLPRWAAFAIVTGGLVIVAILAGLVGRRMMKKLDKPERTMESLRELPEVMHREAPGERRRDLPVVANGQVSLRDPDSYIV